MKFIKKHAFMIIIIVLVALFVLMAYLLKDSSKTSGSEEVNSWYSDTKTSGYVVTVFAQTTCGYCKMFKPVIEEVQSEYGFKLYWFEIDTLNKKDYNTVLNTYDTSAFKGTPYTMVTNNGSLVSYKTQAVQKEELVEFLTTAGVITNE